MANPFDQFDSTPAVSGTSNPFDAFDHLEPAQAAFRTQHGADVPLPTALTGVVTPSGGPSVGDVLLNQSAGVGNALGGSLVRTANVLPFIAGGLSNLLGDSAGAARNFDVFDQGQQQAGALGRTAVAASKPGAVAGEVLGILPKLAAPGVLALDPAAHGVDLASTALQQGHDLGTAYGLGGLGTAADAAGLAAPVSVPGNVLVRALTGGALNAGLGLGEQEGEHAIAPDVVAAPAAEDALTQGGIGAILAAALGHGAKVKLPEQTLEADPTFAGLAEPAGQTRRPAGAANPGPVNVDAGGTAYTRPQGANAFAQAVQAGTTPRAPGLTEPVVAVDAAGNAATTADQHAALQPQPAPAPDPLGLTAKLRALIAADPRSAREGAPIPPKALPAPAIAVDRKGQAMTTADRNALLEQQRTAAEERAALGLTPDIERTQGTRWAKQKQAADAEAERQARLKELDDAIAAREAKNTPARGRDARPDESVDDALTFLAKSGGLDRRTFVKEGLDPAAARAPENRTRGGASRPLFRAQGSGGMSLDDAARTLWQHGYLDSQDNHAALDLILHGVNQGEPAYSIHRAPQDDLLSLKQARQDADHHVTDDYADVPFSRKPAGDPRFSFAGERARTADKGALAQAQQMEAMGRDSVPDRFGNQPGSPEDTHMATGWHRGVDGKWRFEIDDSQATVKPDFLDRADKADRARRNLRDLLDRRSALQAEPASPERDRNLELTGHLVRQENQALSAAEDRLRVSDVLDHPSLLAAYPELGDVAVRIQPAMKGFGSYNAASNMVSIRPPSEYQATGDGSLKSVLLHEIQHAIQNHEGFARGGSSAEARTLPEFEQALRQQMAERGGELPDWNEVKPTQPDEIKAAQAVYRRLAGEVEARNTQRRMNMDQGERRAVPPTETADVPRHQQIVRFNADRANAEPGTIDKPLPREQMERAPLGAWVEGPRVHGVDRPDLFQVRDVPLEKLHLPELDSAGELVPEKKRDGDAYTERLRRGEQAPNARGYELPNGQIKVVDGHRRAVAAMNAGRDTLRVAVSPIDQPAAHVAHAEPASHADLDAIAKYNRVLTRYIGADVHLAPAAHVPDDAVAALAGIDRLLGGRTIPVDNHNRAAIDFDGVTLQDGTRLVDAEATAPLVTVTLHETFHQMEKDDPDLAGEVHAYIREHGATHAYHAVLQERARQNGEDPERISHDRAVSELSADAVADAMSDPAFLEGMAKRNPGLFRRVADAIMASLNRVLKHLRRTLGSSSYLDDVQAFRDHLAGIMDRYAQRVQARARGEAAPERGASTDPAFQRKPADDQTQTPAFAKWFGDSKVVDADGKPLVVYHGTNQPVDRFDHERLGASNNNSASRTGFFFTDHPQEASDYADAAAERVVGNAVAHDAKTADLTRRMKAAERRGDWDEQERLNQELEDHELGAIYAEPEGANVVPAYLSMQNPLEVDVNGMFSVGMIEKAVAKAKAAGNDGVILRNIVDSPKGGLEPTTHFIVFKPEQIKSATGNRGTFDPNDPSILFSRKPVPSEAEYLQDMPSRRPGESQSAYLRRVTRKNGEDIKAATALVKQQRALGRVALRGMMATQARQMAIADAALDAARKTFDKTPDVINYASVHQWETGQPIADADFRHFVATMQDGFDQRIAEIQRLAPGALQSLIEHYMPHLYEDSGKAAKWYQNVLGKRPLEGDKSFLKQRTWPTLKEAMASGLKPISPNPVDWVLMKYAQMDKFIGLLRLKEEFTRRGWLMKMEPGQRAPEGFARVDDPAFQVAGGLQGYFAVPELIAKDINNYLAPGLSKYGAWRSLRAVQNAMVSWNLGWSAFHAGFTSIDNAVTHGAVGLQRLVDGDVAGGLMALVKSVPTMVTSPFEGGKLNRQWTGREQADPHTAALLDLLEQGGARMKMGNASAEYNNALPQVMRTIRRLQAPGAMQDALEALQRRVAREPAKGLAETGWGTLKGVGRAISAIGEVGSFLIHHVLVPNQKMAARVTLLKFELDRYAKQLGKQRGDYTGILSVMNPDVARQLATDVVDKVDFRLGQMTYDNFFYPKIAREIAQLLVMAPGWQAGAFQTMTGGLKDIGRLAKPEKLVGPLDKAGRITDAHRGRFTNNLANLAMLFLMVGGGNALYQWLVSGIEPDEAKDLVAPRTGRKNADDSDERIVLPSYMKDHYEFFHHPLAMASHKLHPAWRLMWEIGHNEDYFGAMIRDPHHPLGQQAKELAGYLVKSMLPFTATNAAKVAENGGGVGEHVANFVGITPASASLARSPFQAFVAKGGARGWEFPAATPAEAEYQNRLRTAENAMRTGQSPDTEGLTDRDLAKLKRRVQTLKPELQFDRLSLADKLDAYDMATPAERKRYDLDRILLSNDPRRSIGFRRLPESEQRAMLEQLERIRQHSEAIGR